MKTCPNCNHENVDYANNCTNCGHSFLQDADNNIEQENVPVENNYQETYNQNIPQNVQQNIPHNNNMNNQNYSNQNQQYNNYNQQNVPRNKKSKIVGIILNIILVGLGYAYVGKWGEGLVLLVVYILMWILGFILLFPFIIALALWIYSLIKTNDMIDKYNAGLPY